MKKFKIKVAPSLLAADFSCLASEIKRAEKSGADLLHVDIMDGHFVKNITLGPFIVRAMRKVTNLPLIAHLMIENPEKYVEEFAKAGSDMIIFHIETTKNPNRVVNLIKGFKKKVGVSIKPKTEVSSIKSLLPFIDEVLVMTVEPGFGGQSYIAGSEDKIKRAKAMLAKKNKDVAIGVDGGVNLDTIALAVKAGATHIIAGNAVFSGDAEKNIKALYSAIGENSS